MNRRVQRQLAAVGAFLALLIPSHAGAQEQKEWTWKDRSGKTRTRAELEKILAEHKVWGESGQPGTQADLTGADLTGADLTGADLMGAILTHANLTNAKLTHADLGNADLSDANLGSANLSNADLHDAHLRGTKLSGARLDNADLHFAELRGAKLSGAHLDNVNLFFADLSDADLTEVSLSSAKLRRANLSRANLSKVNLSSTNLSRANLNGAELGNAILTKAKLIEADLAGTNLFQADLSGADLFRAGLTGAKFFRAELKGAQFLDADLQGTIFEPTSNPEIRGIATAKHLEFVTYGRNPDALVQLRKQFQENGFRTQERKITYALSRRKADQDGPVERWFQRVAFDLTCQYGMNPGRALQIWVALLLFCWLVYAVFIHVPGESGIYRIQKTGEPTAKEEIEEQIRPRMISSRPLWRYPFRLIYQELRVFFWAGFFSLMSAFNIGFRDINFGRWLRLLPRTEYDLNAKGWARTVAGFQSLISVYLIALWVLTYFGRPFE